MHPSIRPYLEYFSLPAGYGPPGLRWAATGEALETDDGTFRFTRQVADFLDGFASVRPVPHFAHVLECLELLGVRPPAGCPEPERFKLLAAAFRQLGGPARNAGALFGHLSSAVPPAVHVPPGGGKSLAHWLTHSPSLGFLHPGGPGNPEVPGLLAHAVHDRLAVRLRRMTDFEVRHWLRHGIGPQDLPAEQVAEQIGRTPPSLGEFLDSAVEDRARLTGTVPLVRHFVSALSLPPRKRTPPRLPIGGYADVTTRGDPGHLVPSQFALDPDEFVRRFAENELLFFRREDPLERRREHLALVVDQGVLTWGPVRVALGAAVLAFGRLAARRNLAFTVRCGSAPGERFSPPAGDPQRFGEVLEASDLSASPGHALAEEVLDPAAAERDIVLLTHPRVLRDIEIQRLSKVLAAGCRLFALTATEEGLVELVHLRDGGAVPISRFRVDFAVPARPTPEPASDLASYEPWTGDVESIPFPFRFGPTNRVVDLAFDLGGQRFLAATVQGFLHVWTLPDGPVEVLPRGAREGQVLKTVQAVLGVADGFVVCGRFGPGLVAVHYDMTRRTAAMHTLFTDAGDAECAWYSFPTLHSIVVKVGPVLRAIDLATGGRYPEPFPTRGISARAEMAAYQARHLFCPPPIVPVASADRSQSPPVPYVALDHLSGRVQVFLKQRIITFAPARDGRPRFQAALRGAQIAGNTLALATSGPGGAWSLHDLANDGKTWGEYPSRHWLPGARLSADGRLFARQTANGVLVVTESASGQVLLTTSPGRCHSNLDVRLGYRCLGVSVGGWGCLLDWSAGPLRIRPDLGPRDDFGNRATNRLYKGGGVFAATSGRFVGMYQFTRWAVGLDCFGQVCLVRDGVPVCMFHYRRGRLAAWTAGGIRLGPADMTGGPETPAALEKLGEILRQATR